MQQRVTSLRLPESLAVRLEKRLEKRQRAEGYLSLNSLIVQLLLEGLDKSETKVRKSK